jgi:predicted RNA methylase
MSLSFQEKRAAQKVVTEQNKILANSPSFAAKRSAQKAKLDAMVKLGIVSVSKNEPEQEYSVEEKLQRLQERRGETDEQFAETTALEPVPAETFTGDDLESFVTPNIDGVRFNVSVRDIDSGEFFNEVRLFDTKEQAYDYAKKQVAYEELEPADTLFPIPSDSDVDTIEPPVIQSQETFQEIPRKHTSHLYDFDPNRKPAQRKRENRAAMDLLRQVESGEVDGNAITDDQKATLAKYSGLGGALVGIDGQKGSAYEYYTPKPIAQGVWELVKELGFTGGKVLDPCAGVGIFGATAPDSAIVDAVELDKTSGMINSLINNAPGYSTTISPFEKVAGNTPDEEYDAIVSNVPFGDNTARGDNKMQDKRYRKESLQAYFILRSLEKLKPGGLAVFIVPPSVVSGRVGKEENLRVRASYMAEFMGAYRLPNIVFGTASADTITDVIAFRKYDKDTAVKIAELKEQSPDVLITANVQWQPFIEGNYFKEEGKRFVLGEFVPKDPDKFRDPDKVLTTATIGEIGAMLRKFPDSRINWDLLETTETDAIIYKDGDTVTQAGQTLEWKDGRWVAIASSDDFSAIAGLIPDIKDAYTAFDKKVSFDTANKIYAYMSEARLTLDMPGWFKDAMHQVCRSVAGADQQKVWNAGVIGQACAQVLDERLAEETGVNYLEEYPELSEAMQRVAITAKAVASKVGGDIKQGLLKIGHHYTAKGGFSALWRGDVLQTVTAAETTLDATFDGLLYRNKSAWASIAEAKLIYGADFDPMTDSQWCLSGDGKSVTRADDYYIGNYGEFLKRVDADIAGATDPAIVAKLLAQKINAANVIDKVDVKSFSFNLFSPHVTPEEKADFMRRFVHSAAAVVYDEKTGDKRVDIDIKITKNSTDKDKLFNRFGDYLKNGTISLGGAKLGMSDTKALQELRRMINTANEQFDGWAQANPQIMNRLEEKANNPAIISFKQVDDEAPMQIPGMNPELGLHGYQNSFVRKTGRDFSGINGFAVGLGKTLGSLAAVQYAQAIGIKKKSAFIVPNAVLSNWRKETAKAYANTDDCLFIGLRENKKGKLVVDSSAIDSDLSSIMENKHRKIYMTFETFERIKLRDDTISRYEDYLSRIDSNYQSGGDDVKAREEAKSKKASLREVLTEKTGAAPYLEDLSIDSIVIDEGHAYKNSSKIFKFKSAKYLSLGSLAKRGIDAQCKAWYIRGMSSRGDGVLLLTATPLTNSPLEIYSVLSLAKGHDKVNDMFVGINGVDDFMHMVADIENEDDVSIDGINRTSNVFVGLNNVNTLSRAINQSSTIKTAADVGSQVALPDAEDNESTVNLPAATVERLQLYKGAFRWAIDDMSGRDENRGDPEAFKQVEDYFGENQNLIGHPFNLINKMTLLIADPELDRRATFFTIEPGNLDKAKTVIDAFNKRKIIEKRPRVSPFTQDDAVVGRKVTTDDETGDSVEIFSIEVRAMLQSDNKTIVIDTIDSQTQLRWSELSDKEGLDLDVSIPPKLASLLENVQLERATPRGVDDEGNPSPIVKQIVFCDILALHDKIKRLLVKKAGVPAGKIAIITGKINNTPDEIMAVQDGFNGHGDENRYEIIIANEKAEVGINLQKGTQAIHHLSIGWTPDSLTQRNGRGVRQGNKTAKVTIYTYDADGTFDAVKRDMVNKKADWIEGVMSVNGDNKVAISGGLSKEQMEALIDVTGDQEAMSRIQASIAAKEAESRATTNTAKQRVNIDTIKKQVDFIQANDPVADFAIPKIAALWTIREQIKVISARVNNPKATPIAILKNQAILSELQAKERGMISALDESIIIGYGSPGKYVTISAEQAVTNYNAGYSRKKNTDDFAEQLKNPYSFKIEVIDGSPLHTEWLSEVDMAKSMIDSALKNFTEQSKQPGSLPKEVGQAFAAGKGLFHNGEAITVGSFVMVKEDLAILTDKHVLKTIRQTGDVAIGSFQLGIPSALDIAFILPGSSGYEACLIKAAKLEDSGGENTYSDVVPEVTHYRTTARVKEYSIVSWLLPPPYFPIVIEPHKIKGNDLLQSLFDQQQKIVVATKKGYFTVAYDQAVEAQPDRNRKTLYDVLIPHARAHGHKLLWNLDNDDYSFSNALRSEIDSMLTADDKPILTDLILNTEIIENVDEYVENIDKSFIDFVKSKIDFVDFEGATFPNVYDLVPYYISYVFRESKKSAINNQKLSLAPYEENVEKFFSYISDSSEGKRMIAGMNSGESFAQSLERFGMIYQSYKLLSYQKVSDAFFETAGNDLDDLCEQFITFVKSGALEVQPDPVVTVVETQEALDPNDIIAIIGNTYNWKDEIKDIAKRYGDGKYKFDGTNKSWVVLGKTWIKLIEIHPSCKDDLKTISTTIRI